MTPQQYCLRWKHHHTNVQNMFAQLLQKERFCDVTLYCSPSFATQVPNKDTVEPKNIRGVSLRAHRVVLAACSELLGALLSAHESQGEPVLVIDGAEPKHLKALLDYMYTGEMNVHHSQLASLLKTAEELRIKGLTDIRWVNKDEPPDSKSGMVTAIATTDNATERVDTKPTTDDESDKETGVDSYTNVVDVKDEIEDHDVEARIEKFNVNGGPPPLIKLTKEKANAIKREHSDTDSPSPKRQRVASGTENTDEDSNGQRGDRDQEWQHGNLDITAERVVGWGAGEGDGSGDWSRDQSDDEWADAPADIGSFLDTRLRVDGDNSGDEDSDGSSTAAPASALASSTSHDTKYEAPAKLTLGPKSGPTDPRFTDVVKLNEYLQHGRRPQFWEENYVKRVMEAVRLKELEMKQAAEILGVSYGTLYGRYRDVYGCINRPYRNARDFWQAKGPSEVLDRLQRGEISMDAASLALGVTSSNLSAFIADFGMPDLTNKEFEPIPIEMDPSLKLKPRIYTAAGATQSAKPTRKSDRVDKSTPKKIVVGSITDEDPIPATVITTHDNKTLLSTPTTASSKWPSIRVASLDTLRSEPPASPSQLMRTRPDLTIVAARKEPRPHDT